MRALVIATFALLAACGREEQCFPGTVVVFCTGPVSGTATVTAPPAYGPPTSVSANCHTCLGETGTCSVRPPIGVAASFKGVQGSQFGIVISLPAREGPATYVVSSSSSVDGPLFEQTYFDPSLNGAGSVPLVPLSGTITVEQSTLAAFRATFDMEVETADQQYHFSITGGRVENEGCGVNHFGPHCQPSD